MEEKKKIKPHFKDKIGQIGRKFHNFRGKNSLNQIWNNRRKCRIFKWIQWNSIEDPNRSENDRRKKTFERQNLENLHKIWQLQTKKFSQSDLKRQEKMQNFNVNSTKFDWTSKSKWKWKKDDIWKRKFAKFTENFTILQEKLPSIGYEMAGENGELKEIRLTIEIGEKKWHWRDENWQIWRKFYNFSQKNSLNSI